MAITLLPGDCRDVLKTLADQSVQCVVTSPPYFGLRDYGVDGQIGLEATPEAYVAELVAVFREVRRVLADDGTLWLNLGDSYNNRSVARKSSHQGGLGFESDDLSKSWATLTKEGRTRLSFTNDGLKEKDLFGIPWMVAFALRADGWYLRQDIIWHKPNPMPESVTDRCTKAHEYVFLMSKQPRYFFDAKAIAEDATDGKPRLPKPDRWAGTGEEHRTKGGFVANGTPVYDTRNKRSVWTIATAPYREAHFATFPPELAETCVKAGCPQGGTVLDPFAGAGTVGMVADRLQRSAILIELNEAYAKMIEARLKADAGLFHNCEPLRANPLKTAHLSDKYGSD